MIVCKKSEERLHRSRVKICGLFRDVDIDFVNAAMPDYAGFVFFAKRHYNEIRTQTGGLNRCNTENLERPD